VGIASSVNAAGPWSPHTERRSLPQLDTWVPLLEDSLQKGEPLYPPDFNLTRDSVLTLSEGFDYESEAEKRKEHAIEFLEAGEDAAVTLEATEETLDFIAFLIERAVIAPRAQRDWIWAGLREPCPTRARTDGFRCLRKLDA